MQSKKGPNSSVAGLIEAAQSLRAEVASLSFGSPVTHVYNPLDYAWKAHEAYLQKYGHGPKKVVFIGMNPGPFGMAQTGVPFGEVAAIRDWLRVEAPIARPALEHTQRPVLGLACPRSEVSGRRLWNLFRVRFGSPEQFFADHFVLNYCPLAFFEMSGRNRTPDKIPATESEPLLAACDKHLRRVIQILEPEWAIGVGKFAEERAKQALSNSEIKIRSILHPSPANPAANRDWEGIVTDQLQTFGVWRPAASTT